MRLDKYIADVLKISRQDSKKLIKEKSVKVNDIVTTNINSIVNENADVITVKENKLKYQKYIYLMMNKPKGYLCATFDKNDKTVMDLIPDELRFKDLSIIGRLDKDTEGLLLFTNDGSLIHNLTSPKKHILKKYYVEYSGTLINDAITMVEVGMNIDNEYQTMPGILEVLGDNKAYITIYEGKFHQVKKMFEKLNTKVEYLKRVKIASLELKDLTLGSVIELTKEDLERLKG